MSAAKGKADGAKASRTKGTGTTCPECGAPGDPAHRPFCSARCRQVDLGRWLKGGYVIPGPPVDPSEMPGEMPSPPGETPSGSRRDDD